MNEGRSYIHFECHSPHSQRQSVALCCRWVLFSRSEVVILFLGAWLCPTRIRIFLLVAGAHQMAIVFVWRWARVSRMTCKACVMSQHISADVLCESQKLKVGSGLYILLSLSAQQFDGIRNILLHASWQKSEKKNEWKTTHNDAPILIDDDDGTCAIHHQLEADQIIRQADRYFHYNDVTFDLITPHACNRVTNVRHITSLIECHTNHVLSRASLRAMLTAKWLRRWWWRRRIYMRFAAQRQKNQK